MERPTNSWTLVRGLLLHPLFYLLTPVVMSLAVWAVPGPSGSARRGFDQRATGSTTAWALLLGFYALAALAVWAGFRRGARHRPPANLVASMQTARFERDFIAVLTVLATIGVGWALYLAQRYAPIIESLRGGQGNNLIRGIGGQAGVATLRYTAAISAPVAFFLWRFRSRSVFVFIWNALLLLVASLFASRLSLVMAVVVALVLVARLAGPLRVRLVPVLVAATVLVAGLTIANHTRNARHYREVVGVDHPLVMNAYQVMAYLGAPFQVSLGVADAIVNEGYTVEVSATDAAGVLVPTFLRSESAPQIPRSERYGSHVDVLDSLTTNSAFADVYAGHGRLGLALVLVVLLVAGWVFGAVLRFEALVVTAAGVIAYGLAEFWRIFLFPHGIAIYLLGAVALATMAALAGERVRGGLRRALRSVAAAVHPTGQRQQREAHRALR